MKHKPHPQSGGWGFVCYNTVMSAQYILELNGHNISYVLRRSARARRVSVRVTAGGIITVTIPTRGTHRLAEQFLRDHAEWLLKTRRLMQNISSMLPNNTRRHYLQHREMARQLIHQKLEQWNDVYKFQYQRVAIRNHTSRWGSCSRAKNLNFNYRLLFLPDSLVDYVVVHELCHLEYPHHQPSFWQAVARAIPDHASRRKRLRRIV